MPHAGKLRGRLGLAAVFELPPALLRLVLAPLKVVAVVIRIGLARVRLPLPVLLEAVEAGTAAVALAPGAAVVGMVVVAREVAIPLEVAAAIPVAAVVEVAPAAQPALAALAEPTAANL